MRNLTVPLDQSITINFPNADGSYSPITINSLNCVIYDDIDNKIIKAFIRPAIISIYLYSGESYQNSADLSDTTLSSKILERLGNNIQDKLNDLISMNTGYRRV